MGGAVARNRSSNEKTKKESHRRVQGEGCGGPLKGDKTLAELAEKFDVHANQITQWKTQLLEGATGVFLTPAEKRESVGPSIRDMQAKIGQLALENDFWPARSVASAMRAQRNDRRHARLPICRQAELLDISRSNVYYLPKPTSEADLALMRRIDSYT